MPTFLRIIYLAVAALAALAFLIGAYEAATGREGFDWFRDFLIPGAILVVVVLLYRRRKRDLDARRKPEGPS